MSMAMATFSSPFNRPRRAAFLSRFIVSYFLLVGITCLRKLSSIHGKSEIATATKTEKSRIHKYLAFHNVQAGLWIG